jgi:hypothetical protein
MVEPGEVLCARMCPVGRDEEAAGAARGVEDFVAGLRVEAGDHEINDVPRGAQGENGQFRTPRLSKDIQRRFPASSLCE